MSHDTADVGDTSIDVISLEDKKNPSVFLIRMFEYTGTKTDLRLHL